VVPSREKVEQYQALKSELEEMVAGINGEFGSINWTPIIYFYRSLPFNSLVELYNATDVGLLTPLRDGMNLVAKEFVACQTKKTGVLILSEMAGAAKELGESIIVNPNNIVEVANAIHLALSMPEEKAIERIDTMQGLLKTYNIHRWAHAFVDALKDTQTWRKNIEVKPHGLNKGTAAKTQLESDDYDFILAIGDDVTDEFMFKALPKESHTIKVGSGNSAATFQIEDHKA
ncbi:unnamed protein product, partial [Cyprideis torosa]